MENLDLKKVGSVLAIVLVIALVAGYKLGYLDSLMKTDNTTTVSQNNSQTVNGSNDTTTSDTSPIIQDVRTVDNSSTVGIQAPAEPTNGKIRSLSMIGPSGIYNSTVKTDGRNFKLLKKAFQPMLINEGVVSTEDIKKVLNQYVNDSWNNGVASNGDIQIVLASSVVNNPKVQAALPDLKRTYVVTSTSSETEGAGAFKVAIAPQYQNTAFVMDVTPTIIRFTYSTGGSTRTIVAKTGSKYYQNNQTDEQALSEIRTAVSQIPQSNRQMCIVLWAAAEKDLRQGSNRYSTIPNYSGNERSTISGLKLVNEVRNASNANMVLDFESMWFSSF